MDERFKNIALDFEVGRASMFLRCGLAEIQKISADYSYYDPLLLFLSSGFERLFKTMICLNYKELEGNFPSFTEMKNGGKSGHDILHFKKKVEKMVVPVNDSFAANDYPIITEDKLIDDIMEILTNYARQGRYFYLTAVVGERKVFNPQDEWESLVSELNINYFGKKEWLKKLQSVDGVDKLYVNSRLQLVIRLEKFLRAISRQFKFGNFSNEAIKYSAPLAVFENIKDEELGKTLYSDYEPYERIR